MAKPLRDSQILEAWMIKLDMVGPRGVQTAKVRSSGKCH
jgi:hypothetical protein